MSSPEISARKAFSMLHKKTSLCIKEDFLPVWKWGAEQEEEAVGEVPASHDLLWESAYGTRLSVFAWHE